MQTAVVIVLAIVIALVAIDAISRLDKGGSRASRRGAPRDPTMISTQKIVVDLSKRGD